MRQYVASQNKVQPPVEPANGALRGACSPGTHAMTCTETEVDRTESADCTRISRIQADPGPSDDAPEVNREELAEA